MRSSNKFVLIGGHPESILLFRGSLVERLQANEFDVHVVLPAGAELSEVRDDLFELGVTVHTIPLARTSLNPLRDIATLVALTRLFRNLKPSYALAYTAKPVIYGTLAAWAARVPKRFALITGLGYMFTSAELKFGANVVARLYSFALAKAHAVFFQNPDDRDLLVRLRVLPNGIPAFVVSGSGVDVHRFGKSALPSGPLVFLMIGRLLGDKGVREYVHAARIVKVSNPDVRFKLVGWFDVNPSSISQTELDSWVNDETIEYVGRVRDVRPEIATAHVYVLPSYREGTPRTVLEAMAMGRPIITTHAPGCRETVIDGENGFLVPVKSVDALVDAILKFIDEPELVVRMGKRSREIAEEKYDVHKVNAVMLREMGIT